MKIILLGAPGSGKGTIAKRISSDFSIPQISIGDIFRELIKKNKLPVQIKEILDRGGLAPDDYTISLLQERLKNNDCKNGYILDGFPRTIFQAKSLEKFSQVDVAILVEVPFDTIVDRLSSRRICPKCGEIYNTKFHPLESCDKCSTKLIQRDDDKPDIIKNRLEVYNDTVTPLINFYSDRLLRVSNERDADETYQSVKTFLKNLEAKNE